MRHVQKIGRPSLWTNFNLGPEENMIHELAKKIILPSTGRDLLSKNYIACLWNFHKKCAPSKFIKWIKIIIAVIIWFREEIMKYNLR